MQRDQEPGQADGLGGQLPSDQRVAAGGAVALVEDEVEDGEDAVEPLGEEVVRRHPVGDAGVADLPLRAHDPLGERRFGDEEGPGDLGRREAAERAQGQGDAGVERERRVAAGEDEPQPIVGKAALASQAHGRLRSRGHEATLDLDQLLGVAPGAAQPVERPVARRRRDPGPRVGRVRRRGATSPGRPRRRRPRPPRRRRSRHRGGGSASPGPARILRGTSAPRASGPDVVGSSGGHALIAACRHMSTTGRTSIEPYSAPGQRAAASRARSKSSVSMR